MMCMEKTLPENPTQVFLVIENRLMRETLARLFRKRADVFILGEGSSTRAPGAPGPLGDVVVLDNLQSASVLGKSLRSGRPAEATRGLVLVGMEEDEEQFLTAVRSGVSGFLLNDASASEIVAAVRSVARGEAVCLSPAVSHIDPVCGSRIVRTANAKEGSVRS